MSNLIHTVPLSINYYNNNNHNQLTPLYPWQPGWAGTRTLRNINPIYHPYCPKFLTSTPNLPLRPASLPLASNTKENPRKQLKETWTTLRQKPTLHLYLTNSGFCEATGWSIHCMTTSRPASHKDESRGVPATKMRVEACQPQRWE